MSWVVRGCVCIDVAGGASLVLIRSLVWFGFDLVWWMVLVFLV